MNILGTAVAALLNSLWQSAGLALLVWTALRFLPRANVRINAATRCAVWWAVLAATMVLPVSTQWSSAPRIAAQIPVPPAETGSVPAAIAPHAINAPANAPDTALSDSPARTNGPLQITAGAGLAALFAMWAALSLFRTTQIVRSYRYLRGIQQRSRAVSPEQMVNFNYWLLACKVDRTARMLVSSEIASPMAVGFRRPAVIVPETLLNEFTVEELDHVALHELAHIARYDDWTNLFARLIAAALPIHPVAVWLVRQIEQEREAACDDWVVAMTGEARPYAASLTRLFELCSVRRRQLLATGMAGRASHLGERIEALLRSGRDFAPRVSLARVLPGAAILLGLAFLGSQAPHWVAFAQEPAIAQQPPEPPRPPVAPQSPAPAVSQVPPVAPNPPVPPVPAVAPVSPEAPSPEFEDRLRSQQSTLQFLQREIEERSRTLAPDHPEMMRLAAQIRAAETALQAQQSQIVAMQAQQRAQNEQIRADEQNRSAARGGSFLASLVAAGYKDLSVDEIIEIRNSGVSPEFLRAVADSGLKPSPKELAELAQSGVSSQYLRALQETGFQNLSARDIGEAARSGVQPNLIRALKTAYPQITMRQIVEAAHLGLNANDLRQAREYGPNLTLEQILKLKRAGVI